MNLKFECVRSNRKKFHLLLEHYASCNLLVRMSEELKNYYHLSNGRICLETIYQKHLLDAYWTDLGGES